MLGCIPGDAVSCATLESGLPNKRTGTLINFQKNAPGAKNIRFTLIWPHMAYMTKKYLLR